MRGREHDRDEFGKDVRGKGLHHDDLTAPIQRGDLETRARVVDARSSLRQTLSTRHWR
jgi:hypothetical protein